MHTHCISFIAKIRIPRFSSANAVRLANIEVKVSLNVVMYNYLGLPGQVESQAGIFEA